MVYPAYFKLDTAYAVVLSDNDYIIVKRLDTSVEIKFGPNKNVVEEILDRYKPIMENIFILEYQKRFNKLLQKNQEIFPRSIN